MMSAHLYIFRLQARRKQAVIETLFGNKETFFFFLVIWFLGLTFGWFCRKGRFIGCMVALLLFSPLLDLIIAINVWPITLAFVAGFLVHTAKPLYVKLTSQ